MPILDHFSFFAPYYERVFKPGDHDWLFAKADLPVSGRLLDAGGGTGRIAQLLKDQASQVVVADLSEGMLQQAVLKPGLDATCSLTESLPFADESFDRVIMIDALHHVWDHQKTADELWRVVKPGGRIVIEEPDIRTLGVKVLAVLEKLLFMRSHFLSPPKIAALFDGGGKIQIEVKGVIAWVNIDKE